MKSCWLRLCLWLLPAGAAVAVYVAAAISSPQEKAQNRPSKCAGLPLSDSEKNNFYNAILPLQERQDWLILVDSQHILPADYKPDDLTVQFQPHWPKKAQLRKEALEQMNVMAEAAKKDGIALIPVSTYRTWKYQKMLKDRKPDNPYVAGAGESQHHLGTAVDFNTVNPDDENIPALIWLREHAGEYGFSLSFPKGVDAEQESGYPYEAWHYRYITREAVQLQDEFFDGDQHKTLTFLHDCVFNVPPEK